MKSRILTHAPARLDVMGGVSDYSGGLYLQWPLEVATTCAIEARESAELVVSSAQAAERGWQSPVTLPLATLNSSSPTDLRHLLSSETNWVLPVLGAFVILRHELGLVPTQGAHLEIRSDIPTDAGVSSAAALQVATLSALNLFNHLNLTGHQIALLAQKIEHQVMGSAGGIAERLAIALAPKNQLLKLKCQSDVVEGTIEPPEGVTFYGISSGVNQSEGEAAYLASRCATFMGRKLVLELAPHALRGPDGEAYLANLGSDAWRALRNLIPEKMTGAQFLDLHDSHGDTQTQIEPERGYHVRLATEHPIYEAERVRRFGELLTLAKENHPARHEFLRAAGELMIQSHFSYDHRCNLSSPQTDLLVELAREAGPSQAIYGAKVTGRGAGGTVALMVDTHKNPNIENLIRRIADTYTQRTTLQPVILRGSSAGACV